MKSRPSSRQIGLAATSSHPFDGSVEKVLVAQRADGISLDLSDIRTGASPLPGRTGLSIKYVAAGREVYRYRGRTHVVDADQFLIVPENLPGEVEIDGRIGTAHGMCLVLPHPISNTCIPLRPEEPIVFPARCSRLGSIISAGRREMMQSPVDRSEKASRIMGRVEAELEGLLADAMRSIASIEAARASTRYENFRRLNIARGYLHAIDERAIDLAELANVASLSRFHLARLFSDVFGTPPGTYHRRLRLDRAQAALLAGRTNCGEVAVRFGFADAAHFSRAYRAEFGHTPSQASLR